MKINFLKTLLFLFAVTFVTLQSCNKKDVAEIQEVNTDALLFKNDMSKENGTIAWRLWRKSRHCFGGLGICHIEKHSNASKSKNNTSRDNVIVPVSAGDNFVTFLLSSDVSDFNSNDLKFYIDSDLELNIDDKTLLVKQGVYKYDEQLGEFGGYKVSIVFE